MEQDTKKTLSKFQYMPYNPQMLSNYSAFDEKKDNVENNRENNDKKEKVENFKKRLTEFKNINTLSEAKELMEKIMPVKLERTVFFIGDAKCTIISKHNLLRICLDTPQEFISYNFK